MVNVKQAMTSTLLLALVAIVFTPKDVKTFYIYSNLALTYINDMMQIFENDWVILTPF